MQGIVFVPQNTQGSPPPTANQIDMEVSPKPNQMTKEQFYNQSIVNDSGIFSATNTTLDPNADSDNRSDCSTPERKFVCPICDTMLTSQHDFTLHIRSHNNEAEQQDSEKGFTCQICHKVLSSSSSLDRHVLVHSGERPFHCKYCGDTFTTNGNMHRHMRTHSTAKNDNYESDASTDSNVSSSKSTEFNNNKVEKGLKRKLESPIDCGKKRRDSLSDQDFTECYKCPVCERNDFTSSNNLEMHMEDNHPDYPVRCSHCKQIFPNHKLLQHHKQTVHETSPSKQPVMGFKDLTLWDFSSKKFPHIARLECETNLHKVATGLRFQCTKCHRAFPCSNSLDMHQSQCTLQDSGMDLSGPMSESDIRRMEFFNRLNLQDNSPEKFNPLDGHNKLREQLVKAFTNMEGSKDLADIQSILSNINMQQLQTKSKQPVQTVISPEAKDQDEETQDVFAVEFRKMKLRGEFPCRLCTAVFPNLRALKGHNRAHLTNNNGTYHCNMCPHSSIDKAALIRHMRTHNGDRPYECSLCNYAFTTKANCERHLRNRHSKTTREEVKKSIIYHPSEDPTNEDLNKLAARDDFTSSKKLTSIEPESPEKPKLDAFKSPELTLPKPNIPLLADLQAFKNFNVPMPFGKLPNNLTDFIRSENLRNLKDQKPFTFPTVVPQNTSKIQVKSLDSLKDTSFNEPSDDEYVEEEEPMDLVLDLSKKKQEEDNKRQDEEEVVEDEDEEIPQDLTKKPVFAPPFNINELLAAQQLLKNQPAFYQHASQLAQMYGNGFPPWNYPFSNLLFPGIPAPLNPNGEDLKNKMRMQMCGGSMINDFKVQNMQRPNYNGFKPDHKPDSFSTPKKPEEMGPLNVDTSFGDGLMKLQSPITPVKQQDIMQSPNSVKMVIKNGVLMPKQKQRRYRTERPFTCEHCSARFTLRSNMERHIKQQHPQFWSQRQRGNVGNPGRKPQGLPLKPSYCDLSIPNYEVPKDIEDTREKVKFAILAQQLRVKQELKREEDEDCALVIDEHEEKKLEERQQDFPTGNILEEKLKELKAKCKSDKLKSEEDLVPVSRLLDNANQQPFKDYFKRDAEEHDIGVGSEEDEDGLVASGSTSEGNFSGTDENKAESDTASTPVKKKSAYSLAPNRVSCPYCSRKFPWTSSLRRHILTHTGQKPFKCSQCTLLFTTKSNCDRHLLRKHGNSATTISNDNSNNNNGNYLMRNVPERPFKCSNCPSSTFSTYSNLKKHISCKHSTNAQGDDIKAQGYEAGSSEDEKVTGGDQKEWESQITFNKLPLGPDPSSAQVQNSDLPFKCHLCEGSFAERSDSLDHIKTKHASEYDLLMSKNALDMSATTPDDVPHHDEEDNEIRGKFPDYSNRKVICAFCMRRFWSAEDLRRHMRTHTGERPFSCDICKRRFTLKHSMLRHRKKHKMMGDSTSYENYENTDEDETVPVQKTDESDGNEPGDLISKLLGLQDRSIIDKVLGASADDAAKLLGVKNGAAKE